MTSIRPQWRGARDWVEGGAFPMFARTSCSGQDWSKGPVGSIRAQRAHSVIDPLGLPTFIFLHNNISCVETYNSRETPFECFAECLRSAKFNLNDKQIGS